MLRGRQEDLSFAEDSAGTRVLETAGKLLLVAATSLDTRERNLFCLPLEW